MAVSFGMLGILLMLDVCFLVNFFVISALRRHTNKRSKASQAMELSSKSHSSDVLSNNFQGFFDSLRNHEDFAFAWVLGTVKLSPLVVKPFPGWKPIKYNLGLWGTCFFIALGCVLLSPELITKQVGVSSGSLDSDLCIKEDFTDGINELRDHLLNITNLEVAKRQYRLMVDFHSALVNDTSLYGVGPHSCPDRNGVSGKKREWKDPTKGEFFPGYCTEALDAAIEAAKSRQCIEEICDCPTLPDNAVFKVAGLANQKFCGEVCVEVPYACPKHTADEESELQDYRYQQYLSAEKERILRNENLFPTSVSQNIRSTATETAEKILLQVDIASYVYIAYSLLALFFPSPLVLFRMPYWTQIKRFVFGVQKPFFIVTAVAIWWGVEYFQAIWYSPDIQLFINNLRAGDPCFVDGEYLVERQHTLNDICEEIVPLEPQWNASALTVQDVLTEVKYFASACKCPFPGEFLSKVASLGVLTMGNASEMGFGSVADFCASENGTDSCDFFVPDDDVIYQGNASICFDEETARRLVLEAPEQNADWYDLWIASGFLAMLMVKISVANFGLSLMTLADPFVVCAGEFLWMPTDFGMEFKNGEGQRERVLVDAFQGGHLGPEVLQKWMSSKHRALYHISLSKTVLWGFLMHLSMFNLFASVYNEIGQDTTIGQTLQQNDRTVLLACLVTAVAVAAIGIYIICCGLPDPQPDEFVNGDAAQPEVNEETDQEPDSGGDSGGEGLLDRDTDDEPDSGLETGDDATITAQVDHYYR